MYENWWDERILSSKHYTKYSCDPSWMWSAAWVDPNPYYKDI